MINRIVTGMSAKQFRIANGIEKGKSIRPYLSDEQITMLETLQKVDVGLLVAVPDYQQRKRHLEWYKLKMEENANQEGNYYVLCERKIERYHGGIH